MYYIQHANITHEYQLKLVFLTWMVWTVFLAFLAIISCSRMVVCGWRVVQILLECPLPTAFLLVISSPVDGRSKLHVQFHPPHFYNRKARSKGTNAGWVISPGKEKGEGNGRWTQFHVIYVSLSHQRFSSSISWYFFINQT